MDRKMRINKPHLRDLRKLFHFFAVFFLATTLTASLHAYVYIGGEWKPGTYTLNGDFDSGDYADDARNIRVGAGGGGSEHILIVDGGDIHIRGVLQVAVNGDAHGSSLIFNDGTIHLYERWNSIGNDYIGYFYHYGGTIKRADTAAPGTVGLSVSDSVRASGPDYYSAADKTTVAGSLYHMDGDDAKLIVDYLQIGVHGNGTFRQDRGQVTVLNNLLVADYPYSSDPVIGFYELNGGTLDVMGDLHMGCLDNTNAVGFLTVNNGKMTVGGGAILGFRTGTKGNITINGGETDVTGNIIVGCFGEGTLTINDGTFNAANILVGEWNDGGLYLNGGLLTADRIEVRRNGFYNDKNYNGEFIMTGGTLRTLNFSGSLTNSGGTLDVRNGTTISGDYIQEAGSLRMELFRDDTDISTSAFSAAGSITLAGTLDLILTGDLWTPADLGLFEEGGDFFGGIELFPVTPGSWANVTVSETPYWASSGLGWTFGINDSGYAVLNLVPFQDESGVPEPATWGMLLAGAAGVWVLRRRSL